MELSKKQLKEALLKELGFALFEERVKHKLNLKQLSQKSLIPMFSIDRIETGRSYDIGNILKLVYFYKKKIRIVFEE